ncbi:hypothetical protein BSK71_05620 [Pectobacterium actinidiae]|uniref:Uncharacterized protein n=1 Tax=Pectobacterium actinidiae TaxID=1507808 RepID=A0A1V2R662_9GAMM|nr:hypothetical protein BSK69_05335 [Pectobacterium actinidiae]ONK07898.1 hypothetical protein BSK71_05620 [Pectobacterium actinidiae]
MQWRKGRHWCERLLGGLRQNGVEQAGKALLHVAAAQSVDVRSTDVGGMQQTRVTQDAKMVRHAGFRAPPVKLAACGFSLHGQTADDFHAQGVAQGVQDALKGKLIGGRVLKRSHGRIIASGLSKIYYSNNIEISK